LSRAARKAGPTIAMVPISGFTWRVAREAVIEGHIYPLATGALMLIQRGDKHEIRNTGRTALKALNFYVPPAYDSRGDEL